MTDENARSVPGLPAAELEPLFRSAKVLVDRLDAAKGRNGKSTVIGNYLSALIGRQVPIEVDGRSGRAKLCMVPGRAKSKRYHFEIRWDEPVDSNTDGLHQSPARLLPAMSAVAANSGEVCDEISRDSPVSADRSTVADPGTDELGNDEVW